MPTAYSYIRFSSKIQELGDSLNRQMARTEAYCKKHNINLSKQTYKDLGISAYKDKTRASLDDMFTAIKNGSIKRGDYIILEALDRLSRQGIDATRRLTSKILKSGVKIVILQDELILDENSVDDLLAVIRIAVAADIGHKESQQKSLRVQSAKNAQKEKARKKEFINKRTVFWLSKNAAKNGYEFNENREVIELIIKLRQEGMGFHKIAAYLNTQTDFKPRKAKHWKDQTIRQFILSPTLYGAYQIGHVEAGKFKAASDGLVLDYFPAIISYTEWKKLQPEFISRTGGSSKHNHLSGLVRCGHCGSAMSKKISKRITKTTTHYYKNWHCTGNTIGACKQNLTAKDLDDVIIYLCKYIEVDTKPIQPLIDTLEQEIDKLESRIKEIQNLIEDSDEPVQPLLNSLVKMEKKLETKRQEKKDKSDSFQDIKKEDIDKIVSFKSDPVKFNLELKILVKQIAVRFRGKNCFHVTMNCRNGHHVFLTVQRKTERSKYDFIFSTNDPKIKDPALFEWEDEFGYSDDDEYAKIGKSN
jgi:DNA invertase Pin-like site-specific DNA recombinase